MKNKDLSVILSFTAAWTALLVGSLIYSGYLLVAHWQLAGTPCVECIGSFTRHFFTGSQLIPLGFFVLGMIALGRGMLFLRREHMMQKQLIEEKSRSAWSTGIISPVVCVNDNFWNSLNKKERAALTAHEDCHVRGRHSLQFFCLGWLKAILPLPFISGLLSVIIERVRQKSEFEADRCAIEASSEKDLATLLYKALKFESLTHSRIGAGIDTLLMQRIKSLGSGKKPESRQINFQPLVAFSVVMSITVLAAYGSIEPLQSCIL